MTRRDELIAARERAGLSRAALGALIGVNRTHIHHVESGTRNPSWDLMMRWTKALKAPGSKIWAADEKRFESLNEASFARARAVWDLP
jgi:DNA-binding XRE family transcriptional regulator